ncbi:MAG: TonB-dependent receptor plug domain-containing protein, partial [Novosphingobium sp.]
MAAIAVTTPALADDAADAAGAASDAANSMTGEAIIVTGTRATYNNSALSEELIADKPPVSSVLDITATLPGVQVQEGDAFGFDDWSTSVSIRGFQTDRDGWRWIGVDRSRSALPLPGMRGAFQIQNAAAVIQVIECLGEALPVDQRALKAGLLGARLSGRFEIHQRRCRWVLDVAHNPQSAAQLAAQLGDLFVAGTRHAVVGMLRDKPMAELLALLAGRVDRWHLLDLSGEARGASAEQLRQALPADARQQA